MFFPFFVCKERAFPPHHSIVEFEVFFGGGFVVLHEGGQQINNRHLPPLSPEFFDLLMEWRIFRLKETDGESMVKLKCRQFLSFPSQVKKVFGLRSLVTLMKGFIPLVNLLATIMFSTESRG